MHHGEEVKAYRGERPLWWLDLSAAPGGGPAKAWHRPRPLVQRACARCSHPHRAPAAAACHPLSPAPLFSPSPGARELDALKKFIEETADEVLTETEE
jgi:hypothetical protein